MSCSSMGFLLGGTKVEARHKVSGMFCFDTILLVWLVRYLEQNREASRHAYCP